jgi:predicted transglutaminase-like cysteine proteinase
MRQIIKGLVPAATAALMTAAFWASVSEAAFSKLQLPVGFGPEQIRLDTPMLPPVGHTLFCLRHPDDCEVHGIDFRRRNIALTQERWNELNLVNRAVNRDIVPQAGYEAIEEWRIAPEVGDCKDYAVTKRHELLARGWPSRALLLSEVVVPSGEHHLVLVVRTKDADLVLDNLSANIRSVAMTFRRYQWVRVETPQNPKFWASINAPGPIRTAMASD